MRLELAHDEGDVLVGIGPYTAKGQEETRGGIEQFARSAESFESVSERRGSQRPSIAETKIPRASPRRTARCYRSVPIRHNVELSQIDGHC